jgi:hypothetical protein
MIASTPAIAKAMVTGVFDSFTVFEFLVTVGRRSGIQLKPIRYSNLPGGANPSCRQSANNVVTLGALG